MCDIDTSNLLQLQDRPVPRRQLQHLGAWTFHMGRDNYWYSHRLSASTTKILQALRFKGLRRILEIQAHS